VGLEMSFRANNHSACCRVARLPQRGVLPRAHKNPDSLPALVLQREFCESSSQSVIVF
jgi:hypothetical protein